ncbi:glycoside hydrolase family 43 protein [Sphingomonas sp. CARO-RG-8B-R24-01]|uniref:glycoside hydrolase family 43 protein n=1 Tax=Sphingomonas sp. CARO-RG-8B-R24-01 TaxID=2914831 RepID=UPI001F56EC4C|nr:glycoside hydrolase family 43 protein [Sphingomonas sp. CARO-RG-8B-R24-01]
MSRPISTTARIVRMMLAAGRYSAMAVGALALVTGAAQAAGPARFAWVSYSGSDGATVPAGSYRNPILAGYHPDPSIVRVGADYYLVNSTFSWFPGIPVFHSRDLVHWRQIGNAIDRPGQLDFTGRAMSEGVFAPAINYHAGRFFIVNTCVKCGGNFVITATNPAGPWSDPVFLPSVEGIDPSLYFDTDGKAWLVNNRAPVGGSKYDGHRALWIEQFDPVALRMLGHPRMIVDGGVDLAAKPVWIEGPHIYRIEGAYYLLAAEGGTSVNHSEVVFRAKSVEGPYVPAPRDINPVLTQRDQPAGRPNPVSATGHADLVQLPDGHWWAVFLGTRPYTRDYYNIGRETFLLPVDWSSGWPVILPKGQGVPRVARAPLPSMPRASTPLTGSYSVRTDFTGPQLDREWMTMRGAPYRLGGGDLLLDPLADGIGDFGKPAFVARRQEHAIARVSTEVRFTPGEGEMAGLAAVQNDAYFLTIALTRHDGKTFVRAARRAGKSDPRTGMTVAERAVAVSGPVRFRISARGGQYDLAYATGKTWVTLAPDVDATNLSTDKAGGFVGTMIGPFAQGAR